MFRTCVMLIVFLGFAGAASAHCTGDEQVSKTVCKVRDGGVKKIKVKMTGGHHEEPYHAELGTGHISEAVTNHKGKATFTFFSPGLECGANSVSISAGHEDVCLSAEFNCDC